jgi:V/A-type H+-transporting ATPase subunit D
MAKIKLTKNELKKQKDALKRFLRYLPTLVLKKQQLQLEIRKVESLQAERMRQKEALLQGLKEWIAVFGEEIGLENLMKIESVVTSAGNIAGVDIPLFERIDFRVAGYDLFHVPLWADAAVELIGKVCALDAEIMVLDEQIRLLGEELRITTQRVNLFEKVKIPETKENIRRIQIYLGDEQTAAVVRGKMAKKKLVRVT